MYTSIHVANFRCFQSFKLSDFQRVNLISGKNNVGKTALLEAIFFHCGMWNPEISMKINLLRGISTFRINFTTYEEMPWDSLFYEFDTGKTIEIKGTYSEKNQHTIRISVERVAEIAGIKGNEKDASLSYTSAKALVVSYVRNGKEGKYSLFFTKEGGIYHPSPPPPPSFPAIFLSTRAPGNLTEDVERFSRLEKENQTEYLYEALRYIEPKIERISPLVHTGEVILHGYVGLPGPIPLPFLGEGVVRLLHILLVMGRARNGVVLIDEVENGFHYSVQKNVWKSILRAAQNFHVQVFATTHSYECIENFSAAVEELKFDDSIAFYRLEKDEKGHKAIRYDAELLRVALEQGFEVR